jgi:catechol 2,3-dioxygenase-like lactoylglutathione lyase family enzyme
METQNTGIQTLKAHLALNVRDVETSIGFYRNLFGIEPSKVRTGYAKFDVQEPPLNLTLNQNSFGERGALSHLGIQVASTGDVLKLRERWAGAGLITRDEMQTDCCYATQDKTWVTDPDGNEWEAFVVLKDNLPETPEAVGCCGTSATSCAPSAPVGLTR